MFATETLREKIAYLVQSTGSAESEIVAQALAEGLTLLCTKRAADAYLAGEIDYAGLVAAIGDEAAEEVERAREAMEHDIRWGVTTGVVCT